MRADVPDMTGEVERSAVCRAPDADDESLVRGKKLWKELNKIDRKEELNLGDLELAHKLSDTIKNLDKICMLGEDGGYGY